MDDILPYNLGVLENFVNQQSKLNYNFLDYVCQSKTAFEDLDSSADIIGVSCYIWNQEISDDISKKYKEQNPNGIIIYGGPNVPEQEYHRESYEKERPYVDYYIAGPGEQLFLDLLQNINTFPKWSYTGHRKFIHPEPTPYIDGVFNNLLEKKSNWIATIETTRGCPFQCSFCDWGGGTNVKVNKFLEENIYKTLDLLLNHKNVSVIRFADANFGWTERDYNILKYFNDNNSMNKNVSIAGAAKNSVKYLPKILQLVNIINAGTDFSKRLAARKLKIGVQSWNPEVLKAIERNNINTKQYEYLIATSKEDNVTFDTEHIVGLPGETVNGWLDTIRMSAEFGSDTLFIYPLEVAINAPMMTKEHIEKYDLNLEKTYFPKFLKYSQGVKLPRKDWDIPFDKNLELTSRYILTGCYSFNIDDLLKMLDYSWWVQNFYSTKLIDLKADIITEIFNFYDNLDNMPLLNSIVYAHRESQKRYYKEKKVNTYRDYYYHNVIHFRLDELFIMYENKEQIEDELQRKIYLPDVLKDYERRLTQFQLNVRDL